MVQESRGLWRGDEKKAFLSEPFYISQPGYRMILKLHPVSGSTPEQDFFDANKG